MTASSEQLTFQTASFKVLDLITRLQQHNIPASVTFGDTIHIKVDSLGVPGLHHDIDESCGKLCKSTDFEIMIDTLQAVLDTVVAESNKRRNAMTVLSGMTKTDLKILADALDVGGLAREVYFRKYGNA